MGQMDGPPAQCPRDNLDMESPWSMCKGHGPSMQKRALSIYIYKELYGLRGGTRGVTEVPDS